ncbi:unnamed protein product, partial [Rotaria socialis]
VVLLHVDDVVLVYVDVVFPRPDVSLSFPIPLPDVINLTLLHICHVEFDVPVVVSFDFI